MSLSNDTTHGAAEQWTAWLGPLAGLPGLKFLEVGSWEGASTMWFLRNILTGDGSRITCVDTWLGGGGMPELNESILPKFEAAVAPWKDKVMAMVGRSEEVLPDLHPNWFDVAYIDGSHEPWDVLSDSVLCWRLVKKGGLIIWDDYLYEKEKHTTGDPRPAIDGFMACNAGRFELLGSHYQVCIKKL